MPTPQEVKAVLVNARALITEPHNWVKGVDRVQRPTGVAYCALGAVSEASLNMVGNPGTRRSALYNKAAFALSREVPGHGSVATFNDHTTHNKVLALFDEAIKAQARVVAQS